jgi:predicted RNA methylase
MDNNLSEEHISQAHISSAGRRYPDSTPGAGSLAHKGILLLASPVTALGLNEEFAAMARAKASRVLEEDIRLALRHFAKDDDVFWVLHDC